MLRRAHQHRDDLPESGGQAQIERGHLLGCRLGRRVDGDGGRVRGGRGAVERGVLGHDGLLWALLVKRRGWSMRASKSPRLAARNGGCRK